MRDELTSPASPSTMKSPGEPSRESACVGAGAAGGATTPPPEPEVELTASVPDVWASEGAPRPKKELPSLDIAKGSEEGGRVSQPSSEELRLITCESDYPEG